MVERFWHVKTFFLLYFGIDTSTATPTFMKFAIENVCDVLRGKSPSAPLLMNSDLQLLPWRRGVSE
jgi:hypothetical protein